MKIFGTKFSFLTNLFENRQSIDRGGEAIKYASLRPVKTEEELEEINILLENSYETQENIKLTYYRRGYIEAEYSTIKKLDHEKNMIVMANRKKINLDSILDVKKI